MRVEGSRNVVGERGICVFRGCEVDFLFDWMGGIVDAGEMKGYVGCFRGLGEVQCCAIVGGVARFFEMGMELLSLVSNKRNQIIRM